MTLKMGKAVLTKKRFNYMLIYHSIESRMNYATYIEFI